MHARMQAYEISYELVAMLLLRGDLDGLLPGGGREAQQQEPGDSGDGDDDGERQRGRRAELAEALVRRMRESGRLLGPL